MSNRPRNRFPVPPVPPVRAEPGKKISDKSRLLWERYYNPMQSAAANLNAAIQNVENILAGVILEIEGVSNETHLFNPQDCTIIPRPQLPGDKNGAVD